MKNVLHSILGMIMLAVETLVVGEGGGYFTPVSPRLLKNPGEIQTLYSKLKPTGNTYLPFFIIIYLFAFCGPLESCSQISETNTGGRVTAVSQ